MISSSYKLFLCLYKTSSDDFSYFGSLWAKALAPGGPEAMFVTFEI
jgi:hypothetical protein